MVSYLHTETHSLLRRCPVLQCWDTAHTTADPWCPGRYREDTEHTAPAPRCRMSPRHSSLRRTAQVREVVSLAFLYDGNQLTTNKTHHTFRLGGLDLCCRPQHPPVPWTVSAPPRTPFQRTGCRTAVCWWTSWVSAWHSAASASSSPAHSPHYMSLRKTLVSVKQLFSMFFFYVYDVVFCMVWYHRRLSVAVLILMVLWCLKLNWHLSCLKTLQTIKRWCPPPKIKDSY